MHAVADETGEVRERASSTPKPRRGGGSRSPRSASTPTPSCGCRRARSRASTTISPRLVERMRHLLRDAQRNRARRDAGRRAAPRLRVPARPGARRGCARQPADRGALGRAGERRRGLPLASGRGGPGRAGRAGHASRRRDPEGNEVRFELEGLPAPVAQHELDHLDGVLILDRTTPEGRREALARPAAAAGSRSLGASRRRRDGSARRRRAGAAGAEPRHRLPPDPARTGRAGEGGAWRRRRQRRRRSGSGSRCASRSGSRTPSTPRWTPSSPPHTAC